MSIGEPIEVQKNIRSRGILGDWRTTELFFVICFFAFAAFLFSHYLGPALCLPLYLLWRVMRSPNGGRILMVLCLISVPLVLSALYLHRADIDDFFSYWHTHWFDPPPEPPKYNDGTYSTEAAFQAHQKAMEAKILAHENSPYSWSHIVSRINVPFLFHLPLVHFPALPIVDWILRLRVVASIERKTGLSIPLIYVDIDLDP